MKIKQDALLLFDCLPLLFSSHPFWKIVRLGQNHSQNATNGFVCKKIIINLKIEGSQAAWSALGSAQAAIFRHPWDKNLGFMTKSCFLSIFSLIIKVRPVQLPNLPWVYTVCPWSAQGLPMSSKIKHWVCPGSA